MYKPFLEGNISCAHIESWPSVPHPRYHGGRFFFAKLHGAPVGSCGRVYLKNCRETLDEEFRAKILYVHMCTNSPCAQDMFPSRRGHKKKNGEHHHMNFVMKRT
jgi:hypothetical protein